MYKNYLLKYPVTSLCIFHSFFLILLIIFVKLIFHVPDYFFLKDDWAYVVGKDFFEGRASLFHQSGPPGFPALLSLFNFLPVFIHPYLRILISEILTLLNIYLAYKIFSNILPREAIFWGLIIALFNPLYLWWACLKTGGEIFIVTFLGLVIFASFKLINHRLWFHSSILLIVILISLFVKPVLFLIPFFLAIYFLLYRKYKIVIASTLIFLISLFSMNIVMEVSKPLKGLSYGVINFMVDPIFTKVLLNTGKLGYYADGIIQEDQKSDNFGYEFSQLKNKYESIDNTDSTNQIMIDFIKHNIGTVLLSKLLNPLYFISLSNTTVTTISLFLINVSILFLSALNIKRLKRYYPQQITLLIFIFLGYYFVYFLVHALARYSIPILFYISVFCGRSINNWISKVRLKPNN